MDLVSIFIVSPWFTNNGTCIVIPVSSCAGFVALDVVSPFNPGSVCSTTSSTNIGNSIPIGFPLKKVT